MKIIFRIKHNMPKYTDLMYGLTEISDLWISIETELNGYYTLNKRAIARIPKYVFNCYLRNCEAGSQLY